MLVFDLIAGVERVGGMVGNHSGIVTIRVESTSNIVTGKNFISNEFQSFESSL